MDEVAAQIAALAAQTAALASAVDNLVTWMRVFAGFGVVALVLAGGILHRVVRIERDHGPVLRRLAAEQRARASHRRTVVARRLLRSDRRDALH